MDTNLHLLVEKDYVLLIATEQYSLKLKAVKLFFRCNATTYAYKCVDIFQNLPCNSLIFNKFNYFARQHFPVSLQSDNKIPLDRLAFQNHSVEMT